MKTDQEPKKPVPEMTLAQTEESLARARATREMTMQALACPASQMFAKKSMD